VSSSLSSGPSYDCLSEMISVPFVSWIYKDGVWLSVWLSV